MANISLPFLSFLLLAGAGSSPEEEAVAVLKKLKAQITFDDKRPGRPVIGVNL